MYFLRRRTVLPRQPGSIANLLAYAHQSQMLLDLVDAEWMNSQEMTRHLEEKGYKYGFGWFTGRDGIDHCGIDQEPLIASYEFGVDWSKVSCPSKQ
jgi:hypothetical protein